MKEQNEWVFFQQIEWSDPENNRFNIDTRDFHVGYRFDLEKHKDFNILSKYPKYFYTESELKEIVERLFNESGGNANWRYLELEGSDERVKNWNLKYIRIWRTELGFIICNSDNKAIPKELFNEKVSRKLL